MAVPPPNWTRAVVTGRTWEHRERLRAACGEWDKRSKSWAFSAASETDRYDLRDVLEYVSARGCRIEFSFGAAPTPRPLAADDVDWAEVAREDAARFREESGLPSVAERPRPRAGTEEQFELWKDGD